MARQAPDSMGSGVVLSPPERPAICALEDEATLGVADDESLAGHDERLAVLRHSQLGQEAGEGRHLKVDRKHAQELARWRSDWSRIGDAGLVATMEEVGVRPHAALGQCGGGAVPRSGARIKGLAGSRELLPPLWRLTQSNLEGSVRSLAAMVTFQRLIGGRTEDAKERARGPPDRSRPR